MDGDVADDDDSTAFPSFSWAIHMKIQALCP
jgi:hypothetical protein